VNNQHRKGCYSGDCNNPFYVCYLLLRYGPTYLLDSVLNNYKKPGALLLTSLEIAKK
jgi:hypothetical protein